MNEKKNKLRIYDVGIVIGSFEHKENLPILGLKRYFPFFS